MSQEQETDSRPLASFIRDIPDFPQPGILFKDITPLLSDAQALRTAVLGLAEQIAPLKPDLIVGVESRGFIFGAPLAMHMGLGFVPVRKPGKLPYRTIRDSYQLEYGSGTLEIHDDLPAGKRVVITDDLLATGGTAACAARLCERLGAEVAAFAFVIELGFLGGRERLGGKPILRLLGY